MLPGTHTSDGHGSRVFSSVTQSPLQLWHWCGITWKWVSLLLSAALNWHGVRGTPV